MEHIYSDLDVTPNIQASFRGATFIQLWRMSSPEEQKAWVDTMHRNIHWLQTQPGYRSMSLHLSLDGHNVIVYAQWDSEDQLHAAADLPEVKAARQQLDRHGEPDGTLYRIDSVHLPAAPAEARMQIMAGSAQATFVNVWTVKDREQQGILLAAMNDEAAAITAKPGALGLALHASVDGKHVVAYAQWQSPQAFDRGITHDPAVQASRATLPGEANANLYRVDSVNLPLSTPAREDDPVLHRRCRQRWATLGFTTRLLRVNGVTLHVAEAGQGDAVLLLHGYPQSGEAWRLIAPEIAKSHRVIIPDLRGMGLSEAAADGYDLNNLAQDMHALVRSLDIDSIRVVGHDWGGAVGAVYAMRNRDQVTHLAFIESALAGAGFETLWSFSQPNATFTFIPFLLMGQGDAGVDTTAALLAGHEAVFLRHLWATFTADKVAAPFESWSPYVDAMVRPGIAVSSSSFYRAAYQSADQVRALVAEKLAIPVLAIAGKEGIGANHEALVRAFASNLAGNIILPGAGHFVAEERPQQLTDALTAFLGS